jgi:hypothetical protein
MIKPSVADSAGRVGGGCLGPCRFRNSGMDIKIDLTMKFN